MNLLPLLNAETAPTEASRAFLSAMPPIHLFRALANAPHVGRRVAEMGQTLLFQCAFDAKLRELAILRAAHLVGNAYELGHHERIGRDLGMSAAQIAAARADGDAHAQTDDERLVLNFATQIVRDQRAAPDTAAAVIARFGEAQAIELCVTVGYYAMVAYFLETFAIPFEGADFKDGVKVR